MSLVLLPRAIEYCFRGTTITTQNTVSRYTDIAVL